MTIAAPERVCISRGVLELRGRVTRADLATVLDLTCQVRLPEGRKMLGARLVCFRVDDVEVEDPIGRECQRLEADVEIILGER